MFHDYCLCSHFPISNFQIVPLLNHPNGDIAAEAFAFLSVFLCDGNKKVQVSLSTIYVLIEDSDLTLYVFHIHISMCTKCIQEGCEYLCHRREGRFLTGIARRLELAVAITKEK